jgi:hypothetical protein
MKTLEASGWDASFFQHTGINGEDAAKLWIRANRNPTEKAI